MSDTFYRAFEERHRGSRELIKARLTAYCPFIAPLAEAYPAVAAIDLGCGRGEWLELLEESGFTPFGIDLDAGMLEACRKSGLEVKQGDAIAYLSTLPDESQVIVSAFHVVEHISFAQLRTLAVEAQRVLKPGGLLIMETPNPENIAVATNSFYLDPTHQRPIPSMLLAFVAEFAGFTRIKTLRLQESKALTEMDSIGLENVLSGVSPDYAVIAQKNAPNALLTLLDEPFNREYGLSLDTLLNRWQNRFDSLEINVQQATTSAQAAESRSIQAETAAQSAERIAIQAETAAQSAERRAIQAETAAQSVYNRALQAETDLQAVYGSNSWRITSPFRYASTTARWFYRGCKAWLTFAPKSRPHRIARQIALHLILYVAARPHLRALALRFLAPFPGLRLRLRLLGHPAPPAMQTKNVAKGPEYLSHRTCQIYTDLKTAVEQRQQEQD